MSRIIITQPALPHYRRALFSRLADLVGPGFAVYAGRSQEMGVLESEQGQAAWEHELGPVRSLVPGIGWQAGVLTLPIAKGDVLIVCGEPRVLSSLILLIKARWTGARTFWWGHYWSAISKPWRAALRLIIMRLLADAIIFYTDLEVMQYRARQGRYGSQPVYALNNGIETSEIKKRRTAFSLPGRPVDLLFIGRITKKARLDLLLAALAQRECATTTLGIIGDGPMRPALRRQALELGVSRRITWHAGSVNEADIAQVANRYKVFVYPGSVGLSLIHGLAYGLPAIVHDDYREQYPEIAALRPGENGVVFRKGDARDLARKIATLLTDEMNLERMSLAAVATTEQSFNVADMAERFMQAINSVDADLMSPPQRWYYKE